MVELQSGDRVQTRGEDVRRTLFPTGATTVSLLAPLRNGRGVEVASIGREGAVGGIVSCGSAPAYGDALVQVGGPALEMPMAGLERIKAQSPFVANLFCRFSDQLLAQVMQSVACNTFHSIQQRAARWLLTSQDRAGDRVAMTQEMLAGLLGVQRTTVNAVVNAMQDDGLVTVRRASLQVVDRERLKAAACECHDRVAAHFDAVIGEEGRRVEPACD